MLLTLKCKIVAIDDAKPEIRRLACCVLGSTESTESKTEKKTTASSVADGTIILLDVPNRKPNRNPVDIGSELNLELNSSAYSDNLDNSRDLHQKIGVPTGRPRGITRAKSIDVDAHHIVATGFRLPVTQKAINEALDDKRKMKMIRRDKLYAKMFVTMTPGTMLLSFSFQGYEMHIPLASSTSSTKLDSLIPTRQLLFLAIDVS
jgi:hypothetical protein